MLSVESIASAMGLDNMSSVAALPLPDLPGLGLVVDDDKIDRREELSF